MSRLLKEERGSVFVLSAVLIPFVFLVLLALVVDTGIWFTHKRQLQNRADAGALAAGVEYGARWAACGGSATDKDDANAAIDLVARQFAGDPDQATRYNTEVTDDGNYSPTSRINVEINSDPSVAPGGHVDPNTSWDDDPGGTGLGPCDKHPADAFSPADSYYVDVGVRERDQRTFMGMFGANLFRNEAHARVALQPALAGKGFIPIAIPEQEILQAQIRYYNYCDPSNPVFMAKATLRQLGSTYQTPGSGTTLWAPTVGDATNGAPTGIPITMPAATDCGGGAGPYIPVVAEVRVAGVESTILDIDTATCQQLVTARYADCWSGLSNIRVFKDNPSTEPWFQEATIGGGTCAPDGYFAVTDASTACTFSGSVVIDFNDVGGASPPADRVDVSIAGVPATYSGGPGFSFPDGLWTMNGTATNNASGRSNVSVSWCVHPGSANCRTSGSNQDPHGSNVVQAIYRNNDIAPILTMVRTSGSAQTPSSGPGDPTEPEQPMDWFRAQTSPALTTIYPTVGLQSSLRVGQRRVLRLTGSGATQSLDCEPNTGGNGHEWEMFTNGCSPWYAPNEYAGPPWWFPGSTPPPGSCPNFNGIRVQPNDPDNPWQCVPKASNAFSASVIGDGIAGAIGNCAVVSNNGCQTKACINPNYYDPANPGQWALLGGQASPRVVYIFVVPYGAYKSTGPNDGLPVLNFAAFYITGWHGQNGGPGNNPCDGSDPDGPGGPARPDEPTQNGEIVGYFVDWTMPDSPGDPNNPCVLGQLRPCVPVLVR